MLTGYRLMWMVVMFDLPVVERAERKAATEFRNALLDMGTSPTQVETYCKRVETALPEGGKVNILQFTDKQYERIISFSGQLKLPANKTPDQFDLF